MPCWIYSYEKKKIQYYAPGILPPELPSVLSATAAGGGAAALFACSVLVNLFGCGGVGSSLAHSSSNSLSYGERLGIKNQYYSHRLPFNSVDRDWQSQ